MPTCTSAAMQMPRKLEKRKMGVQLARRAEVRLTMGLAWNQRQPSSVPNPRFDVLNVSLTSKASYLKINSFGFHIFLSLQPMVFQSTVPQGVCSPEASEVKLVYTDEKKCFGMNLCATLCLPETYGVTTRLLILVLQDKHGIV